MEGCADSLDKMKRYVACIEQTGRECLSLLKVSEGLVKRDIDIVRIQIDLHLRKYEKNVLNDLRQLYESEEGNIREVLTNIQFLFERAYQLSDDEEALKDTELELCEESKKIARKQFKFEANEGLFHALEQMKTFGKIRLKELSEGRNENTAQNDKDKYNSDSLQDFVDNTDDGLRNAGKNDLIENTVRMKTSERKSPVVSTDIDPFAILRSMKANVSGNAHRTTTSGIDGRKKEDIQNKGTTLQTSKHVTFADNLDSEKDNMRRRTYSELNGNGSQETRGRTVSTKWQNIRRARSASPRTHNSNSKNKENWPQGILKNRTADSSKVPVRESKSCITKSSQADYDIKLNDNYHHIKDELGRTFGMEKCRTNMYDHGYAPSNLVQNGDMSRKEFLERTWTKITKNGKSAIDNNERTVIQFRHCNLNTDVTLSANEPVFDNTSAKRTSDKRKRNRSVSTDISAVLQEAREKFQEINDLGKCAAVKIHGDPKSSNNDSNKDDPYFKITSNHSDIINNTRQENIPPERRRFRSKPEVPPINAEHSDNTQNNIFLASSPKRSETHAKVRLPSFDEMLYTNL